MVRNFIGILFIILLIALSNEFVVYLSRAATGTLPIDLVFKVVGCHIPELGAYLMPLALFIAVLFSLGRMHADSEIAILFTSGFDWGFLHKVILSLASFILVVVAILTLYVVPYTATLKEQILAQGESVGIMSSINPGRFQVIDDGRMVVYVEDVGNNRKVMKGVFIAEQPTSELNNNNPWDVVTSKTAKVKNHAESDNSYVVLEKGYRYSGVPGTRNYTLISFGEFGREIEMKPDAVPNFNRTKLSKDLIGTDDVGEQIELQWRISIPFTVLVLAFLAISLSKVNPRQGRFAKFLPAILLYIFYYNLMTIARRWAVKGAFSPIVGLWGVHFIFILMAIVMIFVVSGRYNQYFSKAKNQKKYSIQPNKLAKVNQ